MKNKSEFRKTVLNLRNNMTACEVAEKSMKVINFLTSREEYKNSKTVFVYMDFKNEVKTIDLIKRMLRENKRVVIPYTDIENTLIIPVEINDIENDLKISPFGYLEPKVEKVKEVKEADIENIDLIIVPGVVFDKKFNRIGFGKGYYDRILNRKRQDAKAIAIAYEFQIMDEIPSEEHDIKMDMIITEEKVYD